MLRYDRQTKPALVTLYDIRPGNRAGLFLRPRSQHEAQKIMIKEWWSSQLSRNDGYVDWRGQIVHVVTDTIRDVVSVSRPIKAAASVLQSTIYPRSWCRSL